MADLDTVHALIDHTGIPGVGGGSTAELLAFKSYRPGSDTTIGTNATNTMADVDATNLVVTFTVPSSGKVLVRLTGVLELTTNSTKKWGLRESTTTLAESIVGANTAVSDSLKSATFYISGLTPAASKTYKWAHRATSGSALVIGGPTFGEAVMEVWSVP